MLDIVKYGHIVVIYMIFHDLPWPTHWQHLPLLDVQHIFYSGGSHSSSVSCQLLCQIVTCGKVTIMHKNSHQRKTFELEKQHRPRLCVHQLPGSNSDWRVMMAIYLRIHVHIHMYKEHWQLLNNQAYINNIFSLPDGYKGKNVITHTALQVSCPVERVNRQWLSNA